MMPSLRKQNRSKYRVGQTIEFTALWQTKAGVGVVTWVTAMPGNVLTDGKPNYLYRVEIANGYGAFGNSTRYVYEYQVKREIKVARKAAA